MTHSLNVAIVHYHLKRGGVTRVIESTLEGMDKLPHPPRCVVLSGELAESFKYAERVAVVDGLAYSNAQAKTPSPGELLKRLRQAASEALGAQPDIWHIHNHSLGKNTSMPGVVSMLAGDGEALLLQMHDFAEDGRPENFLNNKLVPGYGDKLYPDCERIHYGVLNGRDESIFREAGVPGNRLHQLPNPVTVEWNGQQANERAILDQLNAERLILYPVRAVRRKNFGELLYWSALADPGEVFATTLGPTNINYIDAHDRWKSFAENLRLPVRLAMAEQSEWAFPDIVQSSSSILTTSIAEGFGLAFLEPWLFGKPVAGRDLPDITSDFRRQGIDLGQLYQSLPIPESWVDRGTLRKRIGKSLESAYTAYGVDLPESGLEQALVGIQPSPGYVDFAGLDESMQEEIIHRVVNDPSARSELPMKKLPVGRVSDQADKIRERYGLSNYVNRMTELYLDIASGKESPVRYFSPEAVLKGFLRPEKFRLLRN